MQFVIKKMKLGGYDLKDVIFWVLITIAFLLLIASFFKGVK